MTKVKTLLSVVLLAVIMDASAQVRQEKVGDVDVLIKTTEGCVDNCRQETPVFGSSQLEVQIRRPVKRSTKSDFKKQAVEREDAEAKE